MQPATTARPRKSSLTHIDTNILLEAGTNEAEILVFRVHGKRFGVNVAKVREVLPVEEVTEIPRSHPAIDGLVRIREAVVPLINLEYYLYDERSTDDSHVPHSMLLLEFNRQSIAFRVELVERIFRVSWTNTLPAPQLGDETSPVTSILRQPEGLVPLLDFESISATIGIGHQHSPVVRAEGGQVVERSQLPIVFADDSRMIAEMVKDSLLEGGYTNLKGFSDGAEAWDYLQELSHSATTETISQKVACVITDIEMPRMDGLTFTRKIRQHPVLAKVPVIVFSSIASKDNEKKGLQVGATAQVTKPRYEDLVAAIAPILHP